MHRHSRGRGGRATFRECWRSLGGDLRGSTVVEFAILALPFFALMIAILQVTTTFLAQQALETASDKAVRQLMTGQAKQTGMNQAQFKQLVCDKLPAFLNCSNILIDVRTVNDFASANTASPNITYDGTGKVNNTWQFKPGDENQITVARIMYQWSVQQGPLDFDISNMSGSRRLLIATSVFKTEPRS